MILSDKSADGSPVPVYIECKVKPNKPTPEQIGFIDEYRAGGCCAAVCYTVSEACRLVKPYLADGEKIFPEETLERWDKIFK